MHYLISLLKEYFYASAFNKDVFPLQLLIVSQSFSLLLYIIRLALRPNYCFCSDIKYNSKINSFFGVTYDCIELKQINAVLLEIFSLQNFMLYVKFIYCHNRSNLSLSLLSMNSECECLMRSSFQILIYLKILAI